MLEVCAELRLILYVCVCVCRTYSQKKAVIEKDYAQVSLYLELFSLLKRSITNSPKTNQESLFSFFNSRHPAYTAPSLFIRRIGNIYSSAKNFSKNQTMCVYDHQSNSDTSQMFSFTFIPGAIWLHHLDSCVSVFRKEK